MGVIIRQGIKSSIVAYLGVALSAVNILYIYPKFLQTDEIGLITILTSISLMIAPIAQLGVPNIILKYYPYVKNDAKQLSAFLSFIVLIPIVGFIVAMLVLFLARSVFVDQFSENSPLIIDYLFALVPFSFFLVGNNIVDALARVQYRIVMPKFYKEINLKIITIALILSYYYFGFSLDFLVYGIILGFGISFTQTLIYLRRLNPLKISFKLKDLPPQLVKEGLTYGIFIILQGFSGLIVTKIDSWMIAKYINLSQTGIYAIAVYIGLAIEMPKRSLNLISMPVIGDALKNNRMDQVNDIYKKSSSIQLIAGMLLLTCVWINIDSIFSLIPNSETYVQGKYVVLFIGLAVVFDMGTGVNNEIILLSNFYKYNLLIIIPLIVLTILSNLWLIPIYGITGAALATAISIFIYNIIKFGLVYYMLKMQPFSFKTLLILVIGILTYFIVDAIPLSSFALLTIIYKGLFVCVFSIAANYALKTSEDMNRLIIKSLKMIGIKVNK
tara:strand:- start:7979 stop:9475 length:1497 start_codon:yes stop_codon:yes gene_type:complete